MGARVATSKSLLFASCKTAKDKLAAHIWKYSDTTIRVVNNFRDLRAHLNLTTLIASTTLNNRIACNTNAVYRVARLPLPYERKADIIRTRCHPSALFGVEASKPNETTQHKYNTAVKNTLSKPTKHKNTNIAFCTSSYGRDLETDTEI